MVQTVLKNILPRPRKLLARGESLVASIGIAVAAILMLAMSGAAWWAIRTQRETLEASRVEQVRSVALMLAEQTELMLKLGELSTARRLVADTARTNDLTVCRVVIPDGKIIADADPGQINVQSFVPTWPDAPALAMADTLADGTISLVHPLTIDGRSGMRLEVEATVGSSPPSILVTQTGVGIIGALSLGALLIVYRHTRGRLRPIGAIREALLAASSGETATQVLAVSEKLGEEAKAWNQLLAQHDTIRERMVVEKAQESLTNRRRGGGDLSNACDAMSHGLIVVDDRMRIKYINGAAAVFLHAKRDDLIGSDVAKLITNEQVQTAIRDTTAGAMQRKATIEDENRTEEALGVLRFCIRPVRRDDSASAMITIDDITQQRVAEEARNAFVAQATHELRTPLTNVRLYVETALEDGEDDPATVMNCLNVINTETRRLERIVSDMLSVAEIEAGSLKLVRDDVRLEEMFNELHADFDTPAKEKQIKLAFNLPPKLPVIQADRDKVMLAIHNLVGNALKYTPEGGQVSVTVEAQDDELSIEVTDSGIGISEEDAARVFDRFYRAQDRRIAKITGSGLGLALAREVIRLHGGDISVDSAIDKGSTFTLTLPALQEAA